MGRNSFPGSPLFCQFGEMNGLVGILSNYDSGNEIGNEISITI